VILRDASPISRILGIKEGHIPIRNGIKEGHIPIRKITGALSIYVECVEKAQELMG
jgi:hypothetical protein